MLTRPRVQHVKIRWLDDDKPNNPEHIQVAGISQRCLGSAGLTPNSVRQFVDSADHIPKVILCDGKVVGYLFYVLYRHVVMIQSFAVDPAFQRNRLGKRLIKHLIDALPGLRRRIIAIEVPEECLSAQLCLRSLGFRWCCTLKRGDKDIYVLKYVRKPG